MQSFEVATDHRDGQRPAGTLERDSAVARGELPVDSGCVEGFRMPHIGEAEIVLLGPEERDRIEALPPTEDVAGRRLSLALGHHPVFDADALAGESIRPARDVAGREDATHAGLQVFVHGDASIDGEARLFGQRNRRPHADADDDQVGREPFSALQGDASTVDRHRRRAKMEDDPVFFMEVADETPDLRAEDLLHGTGLPSDHAHPDVARAKRRRHLETDEAGTDHDCPLRFRRPGDQGAAVGERAQIVDVREIPTGQREPCRFSPGREQ